MLQMSYPMLDIRKFTMFHHQMKTSTQTSNQLAIPEETKTDGIASTAQDSKPVKRKTEETEAEPLICSTGQSKAVSLVTSSEVRSRRRVSLKCGQKRWAGVKKRKKSIAARKTEHKNNTVMKKLTWQISTYESTGYRKGILVLFTSGQNDDRQLQSLQKKQRLESEFSKSDKN